MGTSGEKIKMDEKDKLKLFKKSPTRKMLTFIYNCGGTSNLHEILRQVPFTSKRLVRNKIIRLEKWGYLKRHHSYTKTFPRICTLTVSLTKLGEHHARYYKKKMKKLKGEEDDQGL